jgi:hypothetical protein
MFVHKCMGLAFLLQTCFPIMLLPLTFPSHKGDGAFSVLKLRLGLYKHGFGSVVI